MREHIVCFPHLGSYRAAFQAITDMLGCRVLITPPLTKRTIELGCKHSPEAVCIPFKYMLGSFIEALEMGATALIQTGGGCRLGFYGEVQEVILRDLGYEFEFLLLGNGYGPRTLLREFRKVNPSVTLIQGVRAIALAYRRAGAIDCVESIVRRNVGFAVCPGEHERVLKAFLADLERTRSRGAVARVERLYGQRMGAIPVRRPERPLRVAVIGEMYVVMEPFSNFGIERKLGSMGVEVDRYLTLSGVVRDYLGGQRSSAATVRRAKPYVTYHIGAHATDNVGEALRCVREGYDGIIHVKPFGCMPEISAMSALHRLSEDSGVPVIFFSFDEQTSETGINTRLEAFYDMLQMRRRKRCTPSGATLAST